MFTIQKTCFGRVSELESLRKVIHRIYTDFVKQPSNDYHLSIITLYNKHNWTQMNYDGTVLYCMLDETINGR